jgi:hypothetical protein
MIAAPSHAASYYVTRSIRIRTFSKRRDELLVILSISFANTCLIIVYTLNNSFANTLFDNCTSSSVCETNSVEHGIDERTEAAMSAGNPTSSRFRDIQAKCLSAGMLYEDPEFPAVPKSVYFSKTNPNIQWRRPSVSILCQEMASLNDDILGSMQIAVCV